MENDAELINRIERVVASAYEKLPKRGKPNPHEWTILSGIVATEEHLDDDAGSASSSGFKDNEEHNSRIKKCKWALAEPNGTVLCLATGNKCVGESGKSTQGVVLNDCHAEVLARRGFIHFLLHEIRCCLYHLHRDCPIPEDSILLQETGGLFRIKPCIKFHLYVSVLPCGDATIAKVAGGSNRGALFTGAKLAENVTCREGDQRVGALRIKSSRSNIREEDRTTSMSCSDKIAMWNTVGIQGSILPMYLKEPIFLSSIVVGASGVETRKDSPAWLRVRRKSKSTLSVIKGNPDLRPLVESLMRASIGRIQHLRCIEEMDDKDGFLVALSGREFQQSKACVERRQGKASSCGIALNWLYMPERFKSSAVVHAQSSVQADLEPNMGGSLEVLVSARGTLQGQTRKNIRKRKREDQTSQISSAKQGKTPSISPVEVVATKHGIQELMKEKVPRLSKLAKYCLCMSMMAGGERDNYSGIKYCDLKRRSKTYRTHKERLFQDRLFQSWLRSDSEKWEAFPCTSTLEQAN